MGVTQFSQGVECVIACSNLNLMTGNYGRHASGVGPVRGQNNVQGTCDMGLLPNNYPAISLSPIRRCGRNLKRPGAVPCRLSPA